MSIYTIVDIINGMFGVSDQIIRNHKECEGILYPLMGTTLASALDIGSLVQTRSLGTGQNLPGT